MDNQQPDESISNQKRTRIEPEPCPTCGVQVESLDARGGRPDTDPDFGLTTLQPCGHQFRKMEPVEETLWRLTFHDPIEEAAE